MVDARKQAEETRRRLARQLNWPKRRAKLDAKLEDKLTIEAIYRAHCRARKGKTTRSSVVDVDLRPMIYVTHILNVLRDGIYIPSRFREFTVTDPKKRLVLALPYVDRIVHPVSYTHLTLPTKRIV